MLNADFKSEVAINKHCDLAILHNIMQQLIFYLAIRNLKSIFTLTTE